MLLRHARTRARGTAACLALSALLAALAGTAGAQSGVQVLPRDLPPPELGLPALPQFLALSPRTTLLFADRAEVRPALADYPPDTGPGAASAAQLVDAWIPAKLTGTGMAEAIQYQLPTDYDPLGPPRPLLVAWHGFGASCKSVSLQTTLDEQCQSWGWIYLAVTGIDDKLFGPPVSQQNAEAAIRWMLDSFAIDRDRVYLVGFSMGAGIVANFAARHRDPSGLMIAGLGLVSGSYDWTQTWTLDSAVQTWMKNPWNFGGSPQQFPFAYQRSSDLHFDPASYPPTPGTSLDLLAMATNLHATPAYVAWDLHDSIPYLPAQSVRLGELLEAQGGDVTLHPVSGTLNPQTQAPAPHSWAVLDEEHLFNVLAPLTAQRVPAEFRAQLDGDAAVAFVRVAQRQAGAFSRVAGRLQADDAALEVFDVVNAREVAVSAAQAGLTGRWPLHVRAASADGAGFVLRIVGGDTAPSYLLDAGTGSLVQQAESDPAGAALLLEVPPWGAVDVLAHSVPWRASLSLLPDPAPPGAAVQLRIRADAGTQLAWLLVGTQAQLLGLPGGLLLAVPPIPPALLLAIPLDAAGEASVNAQLPAGPEFSGIVLWLQAVIQEQGPQLGDVTNAFRFDVQ